MKKKTIKFELHKETKLPKAIVKDAPSQGPFDSYAEWILDNYNVEVSLKDSAECLKSYGSWNEEELSNLEDNKARLLWLACLDCKEQETLYFYMGN